MQRPCCRAKRENGGLKEEIPDTELWIRQVWLPSAFPVLRYVVLSRSVMSDTLQPMTNLPGSSVHGDSPGKNTGVGYHALLQGILPTQGLKPGLLHCRQILYRLSHE